MASLPNPQASQAAMQLLGILNRSAGSVTLSPSLQQGGCQLLP